MQATKYDKFYLFKEKIASLSDITEKELIQEQFLLEKNEENQIEIYYAPFEYINKQAKVVIVGITPGLYQMKQSYTTVNKLYHENFSDDEILWQVKMNSSFAGTMRKNLISMLDELKLHTYLGINSTAELFSSAKHLVHTTSVIKYPVFYKGKNYNGSTPNMLKTEMLRKYIKEMFTAEINQLNNSLIIPLGVNVEKALKYLINKGCITSHSVLL